MKEKCGMKKLIWVIEAYLVSFAFTVRFQRPELSSNFEETVDYLLAEERGGVSPGVFFLLHIYGQKFSGY